MLNITYMNAYYSFQILDMIRYFSHHPPQGKNKNMEENYSWQNIKFGELLPCVSRKTCKTGK